MIKTNTIGVMLMASSIIDKKSPRPGCRAVHRATGLRRRTRRKRSKLIPEQLSLSSRYFLKRSKIDISRGAKFLSKRRRTNPSFGSAARVGKCADQCDPADHREDNASVA